MPRGTPPPPPGTFLLSRVLLAAEAAAGEPSPAWERSGLRRGRLGVGRSAGVRSPAPRDGRIGGPTWKGQGPRGSRTMRHVATRAILRPVSRALRPARGQLRGGSGIEWALLARGAASQAFLSPVAAVAPALQNHLRGEGYCGSLGQGEASRGRLLGGGERWDRRPEHLVEEVAVLGGRQLDSFLHREPHVRRQRPLAGRAVEPAGSPQASAGEAGLSASAQVGCPAPTRTCGALQPLRASPLHVGVLQRLGCAKPLVGGEHQESPEEVQGLRRCVRGQEARQRLTRPAGARGPFLSRWGPLPTPMSVAQVQPCTWPHFNCLPNPCVTLRRPERVVRPLCAPSCAWPPPPPSCFWGSSPG